MYKKLSENFAQMPACNITDVYVTLIQDVNFLLMEQKVYSWGSTNTMNLQGRATGATTPTIIDGLPPISSIAGFGNIMFAVATNGDVYGWGTNTDNLLTSTVVSSVSTPIKIAGISNIIKISVCTAESQPANPNALKLYICALDTTGSIYMWGHNLLGQFGSLNSSITLQKTPYKINIEFPIKNIMCIAIGALLIDSNNKLYSTNNKTIASTANITNQNAIDLNIGDVKQVHGTNFMVILKNDGTVYGYGTNNNYQLGLGNNTNVTGSTVSKINLTNVDKIYCDFLNTYFILKTGELYACGRNRKLVNNTKPSLMVPEKLGFSGVTAVSSGKITLTTGPFNLTVLNNSNVINFGGIDYPNTTATVAFTPVDMSTICIPPSSASAMPGSASAMPGSASAMPGSASAMPGSASAMPGSATASIVAPSGASSSFMPIQQTPVNQQKTIDCTGSSASFLPYCASASISSSFASYNNQSTMPSIFEKALSYKGLLEQTEEKTKKKKIEETSNVKDIGDTQVIHKKITIRIPAKEPSRCDRLAAEQQYNPNKTHGGNLIDWVVCSIEDFVKRLSKFF